tara:strand:- start:23 stop:805 length:783 start_codon:yes stop_codon:yes gene_type:complete
VPGLIQNLLAYPRALRPRRHIFLLSHMRAYTSLCGHIMGSSPGICGYYEMHIGYHSWRSLVRQKLLYFRDEAPKAGPFRMFDKILHNDHDMAPQLLEMPRVQALYSLRHPRHTLPSILRLYAKVDPQHPFTTPGFATDYYIARLEELERLALGMQREFFYFDAPALVQDTAQCLDALGNWLQLEAPLSSHYQVQKKTAADRYGDNSRELRSGRIERAHETGADGGAAVPQELVDRAARTWERVRETLVTRSAARCLAAGA